jgi:hypothetical protein
VKFIGKGGIGEFCSSLTEAAGRFKLQGACFAGNSYISRVDFSAIGF